uniref:Uncharacterized protein n=1 Tax=Desertifilum tharense IPPAS B-1220 TaxID=1781255 RepID=A0ACD5GZ43_9CYAN
MALPASQLLNIPMVFSFHGAELLLARKFGFVAPDVALADADGAGFDGQFFVYARFDWQTYGSRSAGDSLWVNY